ncbi:MAG: cell division protein SepF [Acidimicrobiales bacterium]
MPSMWRKAMLYLGLAPDDEFEEYEAYEERPARAVRPVPQPPAMAGAGSRTGQAGAVNGLRQAASAPGEVEQGSVGGIRAVPSDAGGGSSLAASSVRPIAKPAAPRPHVLSPSSFTDAQEVGDRFKANQPVIMNLQGVDRDLTRRLIDFASGLCYGLAGHMERVAHDVFMLTPADVEVSDEEKRRLRERGLLDS